MAVQDVNLNGMFEDELLPELEITIIPSKKRKVQLEIMNDDFFKFAKAKGVVDDDLLEKLTWKRAGEIMTALHEIAPEYYKLREEKVHENQQ